MTVASFPLHDEFLAACVRDRSTFDHRAGQHAFNVLYQLRPDLAEMVRASSFDPFYVDGRLPTFYEWVAKNW